MFCFALVMLFPRTIFGIFTQDPELIEVGSRAMRIVLILPRCFGVTGVWASFPAADFVATAITIIWLRFEMRKLHIVGCEEEPEMHEGCVEPEDAAEVSARGRHPGRRGRHPVRDGTTAP